MRLYEKNVLATTDSATDSWHWGWEHYSSPIPRFTLPALKILLKITEANTPQADFPVHLLKQGK